MSYTVTIEETKSVIEGTRHNWCVIGKEQIHIDGSSVVELVDKMGWRPVAEETVTNTEKVFEQTVSELDINAVIMAIMKPSWIPEINLPAAPIEIKGEKYGL